jgi:hypothetical protein
MGVRHRGMMVQLWVRFPQSLFDPIGSSLSGGDFIPEPRGDVMNAEKILELRQAGYTWNQIDEMLLPPSEIYRKNGKIVSKAFKFAKAKGIEGAFTKAVIGAYTATQIVMPLRKFNPYAPKAITQQIEMFI